MSSFSENKIGYHEDLIVLNSSSDANVALNCNMNHAVLSELNESENKILSAPRRKRKERNSIHNNTSLEKPHKQVKIFGDKTFDNYNEKSIKNYEDLYKKDPPDFEFLASLYPEFKACIKSSKKKKILIDWKDYKVIFGVTKVLLQHDFGVYFSLPSRNLCPPVPRSLNYINWIKYLLSFISENKPITVKGLDIGTGASLIFPLIGSSAYGWCFVGTEVDEESIEVGRKLLENNHHLKGKIEIRKGRLDYLFNNVIGEKEHFNFCMCNPPFFSEISQCHKNKKRFSAGTLSELVCKGGEENFISKMVEESVYFSNNIDWFTSMCGKKSTIKVIVKKLRDSFNEEVKCIQQTQFQQGKQTRWGIAWTFNKKISDEIRKFALKEIKK